MKNIIIKGFLLTVVFLQFQSKLKAQATNKIDSVGNVGIGTTSPTDKLTVEGQIKTGAILMTGWSMSPYSNSTWLRGASGVGVFLTNENVSRWAGLQADGSFDVSHGKLFVDAQTGNVGLNSKSPTQQLFVSAGTKTNSLYVGEGSHFSDRSGNGDNIYIRQPLRTNGGWWGVQMSLQGPLAGHTADFYPIRYMTDENNDGYEDYLRFHIEKNGGGFFGGNVGIGTSTPADKLQIEGADVGVSLAGTTRSRLNLYTSNQYGWQIEVANTDGNQHGGDLGFTESGVAGGRLVLKKGGNVGIGLLNPSEKLAVNGNVRAKKVIVSQTGWPDYVFDSSYSLRSLSEVEKFITQHKRLPEMPSAKEVEEKGVSVGDNQALLLKKIEEMTLYMISMNKEIIQLRQKNQQLEKSLKKYEK